MRITYKENSKVKSFEIHIILLNTLNYTSIIWNSYYFLNYTNTILKVPKSFWNSYYFFEYPKLYFYYFLTITWTTCNSAYSSKMIWCIPSIGKFIVIITLLEKVEIPTEFRDRIYFVSTRDGIRDGKSN
jgi:hypothetical protein